MLNFDEYIKTGYEVIQEQTDKEFIFNVNAILGTITNDLSILLKGKDILKYKLNTTVKSQLQQQYDTISIILSKRFNFKIKLKHTEDKTIIHSMYPNYSYKNVLNAVTDFNKMFPNKDNLFYNITTNKLTKQAIDGMDNLQQAINTDNLTIDLKNAKIYGIEDTVMTIFINIKQIIHKELTSGNITALMLKEIGNYFTDISKVNNVMDNNLGILSDIKSLDMTKVSVDKLKITLNKHMGKPIDGDTEVSVLSNFNNIYLQELSDRLDDNNYMQDDFVTKFSLGAELATAVLKIHTDKTLTKYNNITGDVFKLVLILLLIYVTFFFLIIINIFVGIGAVVLLGIQAILAIIVISYKVSINVFKLILDGNGGVFDITTVVKEITSIKRSLISNLRNKELDKEDTVLQIANVDKILKSLNDIYRYDTTLRKKHSLNPTDYSYIEKLSNNDLHYLSEKLK